jgi:hypothetical protein
MILLAKSETRTIQGQHAVVYSVCQSASPRENDFASRIKYAQEPESGLKTAMFSGGTSYILGPLHLPAVMRPKGGDEHAGVVPWMPVVMAEPRPKAEVRGEPRRVMEVGMGKEELRVMEVMESVRVVETVEVMMVKAVAEAGVRTKAPPAKGPGGCAQAQQDRAERDHPQSPHGPSHRRSPSDRCELTSSAGPRTPIPSRPWSTSQVLRVKP